MKIKNLEETTICFLTLSDISIMAQKEELMVSLEDIKKYICTGVAMILVLGMFSSIHNYHDHSLLKI